MRNCIDAFIALCKEQPFDVQKIQSCIDDNRMDAEEVTRAALEVCDYGTGAYSEYLYQHEAEPDPSELRTYNWERLSDVFIANGLDAALVVCDDGRNYENILQTLRHIDDGDLGARIARNILSKGFSPNIAVGDIPNLFAEIDGDFILDIDMCLYPEKWQVDNAFRFWLVLIGFGGAIQGGRIPVNMCNDFSPQIFKEFERFDYEMVRSKDDFELRIFEKATNRLVATV